MKMITYKCDLCKTIFQESSFTGYVSVDFAFPDDKRICLASMEEATIHICKTCIDTIIKQKK